MKHKILWSLIGIMVVLTLVLAACASPPNGNGNGEEEPPPPTEEPQYGGTITYAVVLRYEDERGFDPLTWYNIDMLSLIFDKYYTVPWEKGPAGTGELELNLPWYPRSIYRGELLESFEVVDLYTVKYRLREGIHYWNKAPVNGRELTVDDIMWNWLRDAFHERAGSYLRADPAASMSFWTHYLEEIENGDQPEQPLIDFLAGMREVTLQLEEYYPGLEDMMRSKFADSYALVGDAGYDIDDMALLTTYLRKIDDYNFEAHAARCGRELWAFINGIWPTPREVTEEDEFRNWETVVGTGPWMPVSYDAAAEVTFERNPDYWQYDPVHPENQLPYADELVIQVIGDESTYYAALEIAQLDIGSVEWYKVDYFQENYPDILYKQRINEWTHCIFVRNDIRPFNDIRVRHACMLAIDHQAIMDHYHGFAQLHCWPEQEWATEVYTPFDELPMDIQALYGYDPDRARELLAEAGYPDGFQTEMTVSTSSEDIESCRIVRDYLAAVGIDVEMLTPDFETYVTNLYVRNYLEMISCLWANNFPGDAMNWAEGGVLNSIWNFGKVVDDQAYATNLATACMEEDGEYYAAIKADNVRRLGMMYQLLVPTPVSSTFWWPWLKNYHGEPYALLPYYDSDWGKICKYLWIDQDLKDDMG